MTPAKLVTAHNRPGSFTKYIVFFQCSTPSDEESELVAFWSDSPRECELYCEIGSKPETLGLLDGLYHKGQFALMVNIFQEIEHATLKKHSEEIDEAARQDNPGIFNSRDSAG